MGFRALKKTLEAPYTTKVNNRVPTTRGTTQTDCGTATGLRVCLYVARRALVLRYSTVYSLNFTVPCEKCGVCGGPGAGPRRVSLLLFQHPNRKCPSQLSSAHRVRDPRKVHYYNLLYHTYPVYVLAKAVRTATGTRTKQ